MTTLVVHLSNQSSLATVEIAISSLTFLISSFGTVYKGLRVSTKTGPLALIDAIPQGIIHGSGFVWLAVLSITHIVGSACYISQEVNHLDPTWSNVYAITSFIGTAPILLASLSFSQFTGAATAGGVGRAIIGIIQLLPIAGFALGVAGGIEYSHASTSDQTLGQQLLEASSVLFVVTLAALVCLTAINLSFVRSLRTLAMTVSMPFLVVRVIYNLLTAFSDADTIYAFNLPSMSVQIFMRLIMEYAIVMFYLFTGLGALTNVGEPESENESDSAITKPETSNVEQDHMDITPLPQAHSQSVMDFA